MGRVAVSGAASGIGAATADRLRRSGHEVIALDLHDADVIADLSTSEGRQTAIDAVLDRCNGRLDGLVTAAGVPGRSAPDQTVSVNYFGTVALLEGLRGALAAAEHGRAVALSSVVTRLVAVPPEVVDACLAGDEALARERILAVDEQRSKKAYVSTKVAVARFVRRNAPQPDWAGAGIRLNAIAPGPVTSPLLLGPARTADDPPSDAPTGGAATPDQVATWIETMLGDAAEFLCGSVLFLDGGIDALWRPDDWPTALPQPEPRRSFLRRSR
jgi:NAD(P)-dependent dehydrogenase (short-subunit alcohol dehydrogenase family)